MSPNDEAEDRRIPECPNTTEPAPEQWPARSFLGRLSAPVCRELLRLGTRCRYLPQETILREGDESHHTVLLRSGITKVTAALENGHESLLAIRVGGDVVGELAAMDDAPRSATVTACGPIAASVVRRSELRQFLSDHPEAAILIAGVVAQKLRWANRRRIEFGGYPVKVRLARVLAELAGEHGIPEPRGVVIGVTLTQPELAALVGSAEVTIHKALRELREDRLLTTGYRRTTVLDPARLRALAQLPPNGR
ncbi:MULTISPECIES: Crp/Fnr family transcriptional regulator [unclassified Embleya]|uniref:Crp/Fnr family transcriptional regulator n=1 Tax=unclassified Embleya TaxID=2699296 RepID=UPI0033DCC442